MSDHAVLKNIFLQLGALPQCQTVTLGGGLENAGFTNLATGQVVVRSMGVPQVEEGQPEPAAEIQALEVSCHGFAAQGRSSVRLDVQGAQKLLLVWTRQAKQLGLL